MLVQANNLNQLTYDAAVALITYGDEVESRNGKAVELLDCDLYLMNPQARHLYLKGRTNNIYAAMAETFWVMAGHDAIDPVLSFFLPRAKDFSDDGKTWRGAYGPRMFIKSQIENVIKCFINDGPNTRRAVMAIWDAHLDTYEAIGEQGLKESKDIPCNSFIWFWIRGNKLFMKVGMRSNDLIWGLSAINVFEWTFLQEVIVNILRQMDPRYKDLELGYYHHSPVNLHVYDTTHEQAKKIIEIEDNQTRIKDYATKSISLPLDYEKTKEFFRKLYDVYAYQITQDMLNQVDDLFDHYGIPKTGNQIYNYAKLVEGYIAHKRYGWDTNPIKLSAAGQDLANAIMFNSFTPKTWLQLK